MLFFSGIDVRVITETKGGGLVAFKAAKSCVI